MLCEVVALEVPGRGSHLTHIVHVNLCLLQYIETLVLPQLWTLTNQMEVNGACNSDSIQSPSATSGTRSLCSCTSLQKARCCINIHTHNVINIQEVTKVQWFGDHGLDSQARGLSVFPPGLHVSLHSSGLSVFGLVIKW